MILSKRTITLFYPCLMRYLASEPLQATSSDWIFSTFLLVLECPVIAAMSRSLENTEATVRMAG